MKKNILKNVVVMAVLIAVCFALFPFSNDTRVARAATCGASLSPGQAVGKALGAGAACFVGSWANEKIKGLLGDVIGIAPTPSDAPIRALDAAETVINVPVVDHAANLAATIKLNANAAKAEVSNAINESNDCMRDVVSKILLDWIANETTNWINGCGQPGYVTNWKNFASDAANVGIGEVVQDTQLAPLCAPFKLQVQLSLLPVQSQNFQQRIGCTLDQIVGNINDFYNDFSKGGWIAYQESWAPQNNYYGIMLMEHDQMLQKAAEEQNAALNQAMAGKGFLSVSQCVGGTNQDQFCNSTCMTGQGAVTDFQTCYSDCMATSMTASDLCQASGGVEQVVTPGDIVGQAAGSALASSDTQWAANIHNWVAQIINAAINRLITTGIGAIQGNGSSLYFSHGGTTNSYYSGSSNGSFNAWQSAGVDPWQTTQGQAKQSLLDQLDQINQSLLSIYNNKGDGNGSHYYATLSLIGLQNLRNMNCSPQVSTSDIANEQNTVNKLASDLTGINSLILQINNLEQYINGLSTDSLVTQFSNIQDQLYSISSKAGNYGTVSQSIDELNTNKAVYQDIQQRQATCSNTSTSTGP